jgi:hypothetical protein
LSSGHETAQAAINTVEADAQTQHISTTAALTDLLGATHGNQAVATALTTNLVNGSSAAELVNLAATGYLHAADVTNIVQVATGTLAAYSQDGHSALGMSQNAAIDVIDVQIATAAQNELNSANFVFVRTQNADLAAGLSGAALAAALQPESAAASNTQAFIPAFDSLNASHLAAEQSIVALEGGGAALQTGLNAAIANPLQGQGDTSFGVTATVADAFSGQANSALVNQILASSAVVSQLENVAQGGTLSSAGLSALESAAATAHVSTDLTLVVAESVAQTSAVQETLATEMTGRLVSGAAETELVNLAANGSLKVQDVNTIVNSVTGALAGLSADGHSALGMSQNAAIDVIDSKIAAAASNMTAFVNAFDSQNASQLTAAQSIISLEGGASAFQTGLNAVVGNPLLAQNANFFGETATIADAFAGNATTGLVNEIIAASSGNTTYAGSAAIQTIDLALALADKFATNTGVQQTLDTELTTHIDNGSLVGNIVNLAGQGQLSQQALTNIVSTVTGVLASHSADGNTVAGMTQAAAADTIYANIENQVQTNTADYNDVGNLMVIEGNYGAAAWFYGQAGIFAQFANALETSHGTEIASKSA